MSTAIPFAAALLVAMGLDGSIGQPPQRFHPVAAMGRYLGLAGSRLTALAPRRAFVAGALAWLLGATALACLGWALEHGAAWMLRQWGSIAGGLACALALGVLLLPMLAWRMLRDEVAAVERALATGLEAGRAQVGTLSSRDTSKLDAAGVRETAIESLAENLSDSVVAPLFWFAVAGLPGAMLYRFANTADAMWGYRGRWEWAGKWAARADDLLSWVPARITGLMLMPAPRFWPALARMAALTPSPNGGWPMGAMALQLGVRLSKPGVYQLHADGREAVAADTARAIELASRALRRSLMLLVALAFALRSLS